MEIITSYFQELSSVFRVGKEVCIADSEALLWPPTFISSTLICYLQ